MKSRIRPIKTQAQKDYEEAVRKAVLSQIVNHKPKPKRPMEVAKAPRLTVGFGEVLRAAFKFGAADTKAN